MRSYGFTPSEDIVVNEKRGSKQPVSFETCNDVDDKVKAIAEFTTGIRHEIEDEEEAMRVSQDGRDYDALPYSEKLAMGF